MSAKIISLSSQKGGVGKSTITSLLANYLHKKSDYRVCVIDADHRQKTLKNTRDRELEDGANEDDLYDLVLANSTEVPSIIENLIDEYDYIFIDLPGNTLQKGVYNCYYLVDYAFLPTDVTPADLDSLRIFLQNDYDKIIADRKKQKLKTTVYGILSKIEVKMPEVKHFIKSIDDQPIPFMKNYIPHTVELKRNLKTNSTYLHKKYNFTSFCEEFIELTQNN